VNRAKSITNHFLLLTVMELFKTENMMQKPRITIGMATYDDFEGVWATVQSVFLHNEWEAPEDVQIVIVDTSPRASEHRKLVQDFVAKGGHSSKGGRTPNIKYVEMPENPGTTEPRNRIFELADAPVVCVMDCHVMLPSNALLRLSVWFDNNQDFDGLVHGPLVYDNLHAMSTHFDDQFRGGMWGTWGSAWKTPAGDKFVCHGEEITDENRRRNPTRTCYYDLHTLEPFPFDQESGTWKSPSGEPMPSCDWAGHDRVLIANGYKELGRDDSEIPFDIPGQGMGLFASRKDTWLGFAKHCSGFGGEEMNIHTKYRQAGRRVVCLPFLKWNHRFGRAGGAPYPIPLDAKIRNYVLWANELGMPLDRIKLHFVDSGTFPKSSWERLIADPLNYKVSLRPTPRVAGKMPLDHLFEQTANNARDLSNHAEAIKNTCSRVRHVTAFVKRADWEPMIAAGFPANIEVYQSEETALVDKTHEAVKLQHVKDARKIDTYSTHRPSKGAKVDPLEVETITETDLLIIDKVNDAGYLTAVLQRHGASVRQMIMVRGTQAFGEKAEFDARRPGLFHAMREWIENHPEWFVMKHWPNQYGLTLLAREPISRPEQEILPWPKGYGPGTELKAILGSVGINPSPTCSCNAFMRQMDEWGIDGCQEHHAEIVERLREKAEEWGWTSFIAKKAEDDGETHQFTIAEKIKIGWKSLTTGLVFKVNWLDPYPDLVNEAISRAGENESAQCTKECNPEGCEKPGCKRKEPAA